MKTDWKKKQSNLRRRARVLGAKLERVRRAFRATQDRISKPHTS